MLEKIYGKKCVESTASTGCLKILAGSVVTIYICSGKKYGKPVIIIADQPPDMKDTGRFTPVNFLFPFQYCC